MSDSSKKRFAAGLLAIVLTHCAFASERDCAQLRENLQNGRDVTDSVKQLSLAISRGSQCAKNTLGVLYAKGVVVALDKDHAYAIFYDLAQVNYPPAQLNLALLWAERREPFNVALPNHLLGLFATYFGDKEWGEVGAAARDFGRKYIADSLDTSAAVAPNIIEYRAQFELAVKSLTFRTANYVLEREQATRDRNNAIAGLLTL